MDEAGVIQKAARERALQFINEHFEDLESLSKSHELFEEFTTTKANLEKQLSFATKEVPNKIKNAVRDAEIVSESVTKLHMRQDELVGDIFSHVAQNALMANKLSQTTAQVRELEMYSQYLSCVSHFEDLSSDIQSALLIKAIERSIVQFTYMADLAKDLQTSKCTHLVKFVNDTVVFWYKILSEKLASEFDECLRAWQWPFIVTSVKALPVTNPTEQKEKLGSLFALLAMLQLPEVFQAEGEKSQGSGFASKLPGWRPLLLPLQMLLKPFQKRFSFHFYGNKKTNNLDKPEWYFTQTLTWIRDHQEFLKSKIQPELDKAGNGSMDAMVEFSRGLVALAVDKLYKDLPQLVAMDERFAHVVDETLAFHRELYTVYDYPDSQPSCLHVLMQPEPFRRWLHIEKQCALQKMDAMLSSATAWSSQYKDIADVDDLKVSECGESFMMLLLAITDRYKLLPSMAHRMDFLKLQLELLDDFRIRLLQVKKEIFANKADLLNPQFCAILNTVNYMTDILSQWANLPFFVALHYHKLHGGEKNFDTTREKTPDEAVLDRMDSSLFDVLIELFELMQKDMLSNILSYVTDDVKARSRPYRHDRWLALPSQKDYVSMALSASACEMLLVLKDHLHCVETLLSKSLFSTFWQQLAANLNQFLYREVILRNSFNEGGAVQLQFDMTRNLFPMFSDYTSKPENYFRDVKEACTVLTLSSGSALLIRDVIYRALHEPRTHHSAQLTDPIAALHDIGIYKLTPEDVELLLSLRIDLAT